jgi:hypothetical protein
MQKKANKASSQCRELATRLFAKYDKSENDFITSKELAEILTDLNAPTSSEQAAIMVHSLVFFSLIILIRCILFSIKLRLIDLNKDGKLSFDE